ncbi:hypothetical protein BGZ73_001738 [Actinomortierella ambigua]|nr:hypothetical protein BGZ73_001738 [Actinomortierella ambigua]
MSSQTPSHAVQTQQDVAQATKAGEGTQSCEGADLHCRVDFAIYPDKCQTSLTDCISEIEKVLKQHGFSCEVHSHGTTLEGPMANVLRALQACHAIIHDKCNCVRLNSNVRIETKKDKSECKTAEKEA